MTPHCNRPRGLTRVWKVMILIIIHVFLIFRKALPGLRRLVVVLSPRRPEFDPGSVQLGFVVDKVTLGQDFLRELRFFPVNFNPPVFH
jgi:hypothetical protein